MVLPILIYGCESWDCKAKHFKKLEGFQLIKLRTILGKKWSDCISYIEISDITEIKSGGQVCFIELLIQKHKLKWFDKMVQMDDTNIPKIVAFGEAIGGKRKAGRPHKNCRDCLKENLKVYETYYEKTCQMSRKKRRMDQILGGANNLPIQ